MRVSNPLALKVVSLEIWKYAC